jgi:stress-induced morphogen
LTDLLRQRFPKSKLIEVTDISGGCGSMYAIYVETSEFKNLRTVKQHQLVNEVLKQQIKSMHGLRIQTAVADD